MRRLVGYLWFSLWGLVYYPGLYGLCFWAILLMVVSMAVGWFFGSGHLLQWPFRFSVELQSPVVPS